MRYATSSAGRSNAAYSVPILLLRHRYFLHCRLRRILSRLLAFPALGDWNYLYSLPRSSNTIGETRSCLGYLILLHPYQRTVDVEYRWREPEQVENTQLVVQEARTTLYSHVPSSTRSKSRTFSTNSSSTQSSRTFMWFF